jgi:prevent-host-death family protein
VADTYSLYEAKAKLSAIVRRVREGRRAIVTVHGKPVAEIRPIQSRELGIEARMEALAEAGVLQRPAGVRHPLRPITRRRGALKRFLRDRDA